MTHDASGRDAPPPASGKPAATPVAGNRLASFAAGGRFAAFATHGGDLASGERLFPAAPRPWLDLSTGLNPRPFPVPELPASAWERLPDPGAQAALERLAHATYGAAPADTVLAGPGTQALIQALAQVHTLAHVHAPRGHGRPPQVRVLGRSYGGHRAAWAAAGATVDTVADAGDLPDADVAVVVNPNNPDGRLLPPGPLREVAGQLARRGGMLVVDEAFMDVLPPADSLLPGGVPANAVVLRSFGKMYGLGGVRLGFLFGAGTRTARVRAALGDWAVSGPALAVGRPALADREWRNAAVVRLRGDALRLDELLRAHGFDALGGTPLFRLVGHPAAPRVFEGLAEAGILVRPFADRPWLRFGTPASEHDLARLATALNHVAPGRTDRGPGGEA